MFISRLVLFSRLVIRVGGCRGKGTELSAAGDVLPNYLLPPWCRLLVVYDTFVERALLLDCVPVKAMGTIPFPAGLARFSPVIRLLSHEPLVCKVFSFGKVQIVTSFARKKRPLLDALNFICYILSPACPAPAFYNRSRGLLRWCPPFSATACRG